MNNYENASLENVYKTYDLLLAAIVQMHGMPITGIEWQEERRCAFFFEKSEYLEDLLAAFWQQKLRVEPHRLFESIKSVKARLHSSR